METTKKIPAIRFKGFEEEWVTRELNRITEKYDNLRIPVKASNRTRGNIPYYGANGIQDYVKGFTHDGEFVLIAEDGANNLKNYPINYVSGKIWVNNHAHVLKGKDDQIKTVFLSFVLSTTNFEQFLVGGSRSKLNAETMMKIVVSLTLDQAEQIQIGNYFKEVDEMIRLQEQKLEKINNLKKAMLEKMFPITNADVPEIRFKGFTDKWEKKMLGEVADIIGGGTPSTSNADFWHGSIDWYSPTEIGTKVFADGSEKKITELGLEKSSATILPANRTVLFTSRAGIGDMAILRHQATTNQGFQSLVLKVGYDVYFIYSMGFLIKDYALKYASGSTFLEISGKVLAKMALMVPSLGEQKKIGKYFQSLDQLITQSQQKIKQLKNLKQAFLQKMLI